jgi:hypothetical protein
MSQILLYQSEDGRTKLDVRLENQTVWLSQKQLTELFGKAKGTISEHIKHIFEDGELEEISVVRLFRTTATSTRITMKPKLPKKIGDSAMNYFETSCGLLTISRG